MSLVAFSPTSNTGWGSFAPPTSAVSVFERDIAQGVASAAPPPPPSTASAFDQDRFQKPVSALLDATLEAAADPDQAVPDENAVREAIKLLTMLPPGIEAPEAVIEPSGTIAWVWERDNAFVVLAINGCGQVQRSAVINGAETSGRALLSDRLSREELDLLARFRSAHG